MNADYIQKQPVAFKDVTLSVSCKPVYSFSLNGWVGTFSETDAWRDYSELRGHKSGVIIVRWTDSQKLTCELMSASPDILSDIAPRITETLPDV